MKGNENKLVVITMATVIATIAVVATYLVIISLPTRDEIITNRLGTCSLIYRLQQQKAESKEIDLQKAGRLAAADTKRIIAFRESHRSAAQHGYRADIASGYFTRYLNTALASGWRGGGNRQISGDAIQFNAEL